MSLAHTVDDAMLQIAEGPGSSVATLVAVHTVDNDQAALRTAAKLRDAASINSNTSFDLVSLPENADLIIVIAAPCTDPLFRGIAGDPVCRRNRDRVIVYSEMDNPLAVFPGVYGGIRGTEIDPTWAVPGPYLDKMRSCSIPGDGVGQPDRWLYSFVGSVWTHPVRRELMRLNDTRARLVDVSEYTAPNADLDGDAKHDLQRTYDETIAQSQFVLCPRGVAEASIRFYECLRAGRVPVVISDGCVLPPGPNWDEFVLWVREGEVDRLPDLLREHESDAPRRGAAARSVWEAWYAPERMFASLAQAGVSILTNRSSSSAGSFFRTASFLAKPHHAKRVGRYYVKSLLQMLRLKATGRAVHSRGAS